MFCLVNTKKPKQRKKNKNMKHIAKSIRAFIGAINFQESRLFYKDLGFEESVISKDMSYFKVSDKLGFYLQDAYVKDWVDNSMIFLEVDDVNRYWYELQSLGLNKKMPAGMSQVLSRKQCS